MNLRRWLSRSPAPAKLRVDGQMLALEGGRTRWANAERTIESMDPAKVEALAANGEILRVLLFNEDGATEEDKVPPKGESETAQLARVIGDVGDRAALRHAEAYQSAFNALMGLTAVLAKRLTSIEMAYHRMITRLPTVETDGDGDLDQMAKAMLLQTMMGGVPPGAQPQPTNGKPKA